MTRRYVYGVYPSHLEAEVQADQIVSNGVPKSAISIVTNAAFNEQHSLDYDYIQLEELEDDRGWLEKLFGIGEDYDENTNDIDFGQYSSSLNQGEVLLVVDSEYEGTLLNTTTQNKGVEEFGRDLHSSNDEFSHYDRNHDVTALNDGTEEVDSENIRLHEERVNIDTVRKDKGDVEITKEVITETQTVEVPVEREEIHIKHKTPIDNGVADPHAFEEEEIVVPISEEEVNVHKDTVVTDEIEVSKTAHTDYKEVSEETRREELNIHNDDNITIDEDDRTF